MISSPKADSGRAGTRAIDSRAAAPSAGANIRAAASSAAKGLLLIWQSAAIAAGFLWLRPARLFMRPELAPIVVFHVPCAIVATVASTVATWYAIAYLVRRRTADDIKSRASYGFALLMWLLTTVTGAVFAKAQWGAYWSWDIKQTSMLMLLLINVAYFVLRSAFDNPHKQAAIAAAYAIFAMVAVSALAYILPNSTAMTLHPKGVITTKEGLDAQYKIVLWSGVICLMVVYVWAFRIQVCFEELSLRARRRVSPEPTNKVIITNAGSVR